MFVCFLFLILESAMNRLDLAHDPPVRILLEEQPDTVLAVGKTYLNTYNIKNQNKVEHSCIITLN